MRIEIYPRAEADIIRQFRCYLVDRAAPVAAFRFREAAIESIQQLTSHPRMGTLFRGSISGLRSWPVKGFESSRIYYIESPRLLRVVRILHGKRDVRRVLRQEQSAPE